MKEQTENKDWTKEDTIRALSAFCLIIGAGVISINEPAGIAFLLTAIWTKIK